MNVFSEAGTDFTVEKEHALSLYREEAYNKVVDYIDGLYGWSIGELGQDRGGRDVALSVMSMIGIDIESLREEEWG